MTQEERAARIERSNELNRLETLRRQAAFRAELLSAFPTTTDEDGTVTLDLTGVDDEIVAAEELTDEEEIEATIINLPARLI